VELYIGQSANIYLRLYSDGILTDPLGSVTAKLFDELVLIETLDVIDVEPGIYKVILSSLDTYKEGELSIEWSYDDIIKTDVYNVVTPYIDTFDLLEIMPEGTEWADAKYAEQYARYKINSATGQTFGNQSKILDGVKGRGTDVLPLPQRAIRIDKLFENNRLVIDIDQNYNVFNDKIKISPSKYSLLIDKEEDVVDFRQTGIKNRGGAFKESFNYSIKGKFGWESVPPDIASCSKELIKSYLCSDKVYKESYLLAIQNGDWSLEFNPGVFSSTGNVYCDHILSDYININLVVI
jgi:hypothetical protein